MSRLLILGATGRLGRHVLSQAVAGGHEVTVLVRTPSKLPAELRERVSMHTGDLSALVPLELVRGQDALINCAGHVADGETFVGLIDRLVIGVSILARDGAAGLLVPGRRGAARHRRVGRRGVDLPTLKSSFWPHRANFERLMRSNLDWRLLCPGPMVDAPAIGLDRLRISLDVAAREGAGSRRRAAGVVVVASLHFGDSATHGAVRRCGVRHARESRSRNRDDETSSWPGIALGHARITLRPRRQHVHAVRSSCSV